MCYENIGVDEENFSLRCRESVVDFICKAPAIVRSLRHIEASFCKVLDQAFSYNGRCSPDVEFFGFILFGSMFGGSVVDWSELLIKVFTSCRFQFKQKKNLPGVERVACFCTFANCILVYFCLKGRGNTGFWSITRENDYSATVLFTSIYILSPTCFLVRHSNKCTIFPLGLQVVRIISVTFCCRLVFSVWFGCKKC